MLSNTKIFQTLRLLLITIVAMPLFFSNARSQYCEAATVYYDEYICEFYFNTIENADCDFSSEVADYTSMTTTVKMGDTYDVKVVNGNPWSSDMVSMWIDFNQDGKFDQSSEEFKLSSSDGASTFTGTIKIPSDASVGSTRLRVRMTYSSTPTPCDKSNYGEVEDYTVNIIPPIPDAQITAMTSPVKPFLVGSYPVVVTLKSTNEIPMLSCKIDWWVNNIQQNTISWTGNMRNGQTTNVNLGNYNFVYPEDETKFETFKLRFTVKDVNGKNPDADPNNDTYQANTLPTLNDCGAIGFFGPAEGFGAGITAVRARVMNYAPKPLSSVTVNWKIDGEVQTPITFTGLSVKQNQYVDLNMGTYNFYNKTPLGPFNVEVWTEKPNNVIDENSTNDKYTGGIGPSLTAGVYFAGGSNAHFSSPSEAASYLNSSGVFGQGTVVIEIRPGNYNGQLIFNNPLSNKNPVIFRSSTGMAYDVTISNSPSSANNFVVQLANVYNVSFESLTLRNNNNNISNAGKIIDAKNVNGLTLKKVVLNGVASSPELYAYNLMTTENTDNILIMNSEFHNGSVSLMNTSDFSPEINIENNTFINFSMFGIHNTLNPPAIGDNVEIAYNTLKSVTGNPNGVIYSMNGTSINNNVIADVVGGGNPNDAIIKVMHSAPDKNNTAWINNNTISNCSNMNGIQLSNVFAIVNKNQVVMSQSANYGLALVDVLNSDGFIGNNMLMGSNIMAMDIDNSPKLEVIYNTASAEFDANPLVRVSGEPAKIMRNVFVNKGSGVAILTMSADGIDQNIMSTNGNILANLNGVNYATMDDVHDAGMMLNSSEIAVEFFSPSDPHLKVYSAALLFNTPLFNIDENYDGWLIESEDYDGDQRISYYAGSDEIFLSIKIERQTDGFVDCIGTTDNILTVSSAIGYNAPMTYQWYHDNSPIKGATEPILYFTNLRHQQAGVYKCLVKGPGKTEPVYSREVAVYVARPTDIIRQPISQKVLTGEVVTLSFDAHVNGKQIEEAIANDEVKVQWYKYVDEANDIPLVDNAWVSGSKSNYLTFNNFRKNEEGQYYAIIDGLCGSVKTSLVNVSEEIIDLLINQSPSDATICLDEMVQFTVNASTSSTKNINYQWMKDGVDLIDIPNKLEGTNTNTLNILKVDQNDGGLYSVYVTLEDTPLSETLSATLTTMNEPVITLHPQDATVELRGKLILDVIAEGENLSYSWYKDDELLLTSETPTFEISDVELDDAGEYYVFVINDCGSVLSNTITVTVTTGTTSVVEVSDKGYSLSTAIPNPVQHTSVINFNVPTESYVKITLTDAAGSGNIILTEGHYSQGLHSVNINASDNNLVSGTYFYSLESNGVRLTQKLVVIR